MKIALLPNLTRSHALSVTDDVCKYLEKYNAEYYFETETAEKYVIKSKPSGCLRQSFCHFATLLSP